ncbi:MAG: molybdopterin converting factor subunit 1 [Pseudomonadota bacterium]
MKLLYFAWVRERIGTSEEERDIPPRLKTAADLKAWLASLDEGYAYAFEDQAVVRVAFDKQLVNDDALIADAREAAFFPPMTGG